uniref:type III pantothenate kinase n=1 Tax=Microbulbifer agarilyticus TaxID=260552 RepID=UPI000255BA53|nr:type III pantothenate kinase [Microbulbifer agarilyticus]
MILELDQGNTRGKWRLLRVAPAGVSQVVTRGAFAPGPWWSAEHLPDAWFQHRPTRVRCGNVAGAQVAQQIATRLQQEFAVPVAFARVSPECAGVTCAYQEIGRLGVDRWLAVLAAFARDSSPALVVDCGSAVTLDLLGDGGRHLGGYIVPGLGLMRRALYADTDAVKVDAVFSRGMPLVPGMNTEQAVNHGLPLMVLGAVEMAQRELLRQLQSVSGTEAAAPRLLVTGGDGAFIASLRQTPNHSVVEVVDELVMDGLAYADLAEI